MKYYVSITETLNRVVSVDAENEKEAVSRVEDAYFENKVTLSGDDYVGYSVDIEDEQEDWQEWESDGVGCQHII
jgi:hypothetical protein